MKNVGIICGGFSSEFEISVKSGKNIRDNFPDGYNTFIVLLTKEGWFAVIENERIKMNSTDMTFTWDGNITKLDLAVVYTHGDPGENGKVQAYLEMIDVPYLNSGPLASQLSFDKWYCNQFLKGFGINVAKSIYLANEQNIPSSDRIISELGLPVFVKPCDSGSSFGIARVNKKEELHNAIKNAFAEGNSVVIESFLRGTEVTCGVFRSRKGVEALPLTEIISKNEFFDYEAKYQGLSDEITPARIDDRHAEEVQNTAKRIYQLLNLRSIARIDFMLVDGKPYVIEVNTTPGFSNESIVPKMIKTAGMTVKQFWTEVIETEINQ